MTRTISGCPKTVAWPQYLMRRRGMSTKAESLDLRCLPTRLKMWGHRVESHSLQRKRSSIVRLVVRSCDEDSVQRRGKGNVPASRVFGCAAERHIWRLGRVQ